jgi:hypothetical protein
VDGHDDGALLLEAPQDFGDAALEFPNADPAHGGPPEGGLYV